MCNTSLFESLEKYSDSFLEKHEFVKQQYGWVKDPFHQWSRQWEYPFVFNAVRSYVSERKLDVPTILDAGSGITFFPFCLQEQYGHGSITCCDADQSLYPLFQTVNQSRGANKAVGFDAADLGKLPYKNDNFDVIYCISVLEHTKNHVDVITEFARVLRPGGILILTFDIALDGVSNILPAKAEMLVELIEEKFQANHHTTITEALTGNIVTSSYIGTLDQSLLPWPFPRLSWLKAAFTSGKLPTGLKKNLTFCCDIFCRQDGAS